MLNIKDIENSIILGDCIAVLSKIPGESVDLVFADPPYNLQLKNVLYRPNQTLVDAVNDDWDKFVSLESYDTFCLAWLNECRRVLKKNGSLWVIGTYHNIFRIGKIIQDLGYWILNDIVWVKTNPMPNFKGTRFNNAHETLIWAAKDPKSKPVFHYKSMKVHNDDKQMRSDWYLQICNGSERIRINGEKAHSTQKPEALLRRIILATSNPNDLVLDPFIGSGTTGAVAKLLNRRYIGIEKEQKYVEMANKRIDAITPVAIALLGYEIEEKKPRVPFGNLLDVGLISPGDILYSKDLEKTAYVQADSSVKYKNFIGSIHKVGAIADSKPACNGWEYWYIKKNDRLVSINDLRSKYIENYHKESR